MLGRLRSFFEALGCRREKEWRVENELFSFFLQCTKEARETSIETAALRTGVSSVRRVREASRFRDVHATNTEYTTIAFAPSPTRSAPLLSTLPLPKFDERFTRCATLSVF